MKKYLSLATSETIAKRLIEYFVEHVVKNGVLPHKALEKPLKVGLNAV